MQIKVVTPNNISTAYAVLMIVFVISDLRLYFLNKKAQIKKNHFIHRIFSEAHNMKTKILALVVIVSTLGLAGCATNPYGNAYNVNDARQMQEVYYGTVVRTQAVTLNGNGNGIGTLAGGAIGGILGSGVGGGTGSEIASIGGALLGGYLGNAAGNQATKRNGVNLTIKMDSGRTVSIVQQVNPQVMFHTGERVQVNKSDNGTSRVTPA